MPDPTPPPEPDDDDLIAYLDGELDDAAAEQVEDRLAHDPAARSRADEYKKAYDLLDYLPRPEPSATFASRTLTRALPAQPSAALPIRRRVWFEVLAWVALTILAGVLAFAIYRAWPLAPPPAPIGLDDLPVIESLPLYAGVDDIEFVRELHRADLFDADPTDFDPTHRDTLPSDQREKLIDQFRRFTPARRDQLRALHRTLADPATPDRLPLLRTLDAYAVWLARLPDADRRRVLDAAPEQRLEAVKQVGERRWREGLAQRQQEQLKHVDGPEERLELLARFRADEADRRQEWDLAHRLWQQASGKEHGRDFRPWPFDQPGAERQVNEFIQAAFGLDPARPPTRPKKGEKPEGLPAGCRLTQAEAGELFEVREAVGRGERWFSYAALLLRLADKYPTLPRFPTGRPVLTTAAEFRAAGYILPKDDVLKRRPLVGKWPDFAEEVAKVNPSGKPLGPCKPGEFSEAVNRFVGEALPNRLTPAEKDRLKGLEGRWPDYPREVMKLAREKNLSVPEVTLPGEPERWKQLYQTRPTKK
ncbi:MAG: hypothetical protein MUF18_15805 [Fimbriiglobus sp.]|nr:hypothetical protein [Fimbriiglobus sp.]